TRFSRDWSSDVCSSDLPFITEAIWQRVATLAGCTGDTIMVQPYPQVQPQQFAAARDDMEWLKHVVVAIRNIRGEMNLSPSKPLRSEERRVGKECRARGC